MLNSFDSLYINSISQIQSRGQGITHGEKSAGELLLLQELDNLIRFKSLNSTREDATQMNKAFLDKIFVIVAILACFRTAAAEGVNGTNIVVLRIFIPVIIGEVEDKTETFGQLEFLEGDMDGPVVHLEVIGMVFSDTLEGREEVESGVTGTLGFLSTVAPINEVVNGITDEVLVPSDYIVKVRVGVAEFRCVSEGRRSPNLFGGLVERFKS